MSNRFQDMVEYYAEYHTRKGVMENATSKGIPPVMAKAIADATASYRHNWRVSETQRAIATAGEMGDLLLFLDIVRGKNERLKPFSHLGKGRWKATDGYAYFIAAKCALEEMGWIFPINVAMKEGVQDALVIRKGDGYIAITADQLREGFANRDLWAMELSEYLKGIVLSVFKGVDDGDDVRRVYPIADGPWDREAILVAYECHRRTSIMSLSIFLSIVEDSAYKPSDDWRGWDGWLYSNDHPFKTDNAESVKEGFQFTSVE